MSNDQTAKMDKKAWTLRWVGRRYLRASAHMVPGTTPLPLSTCWAKDLGARLNFAEVDMRFAALGGEKVRLRLTAGDADGHCVLDMCGPPNRAGQRRRLLWSADDVEVYETVEEAFPAGAEAGDSASALGAARPSQWGRRR